MVDIKRLFSPAASVYAPSITVSSEGSDVDWHDTTPVSSPSPAPTTPSRPLQPSRPGFSPDVSRHFMGIEKQFEQLHDKLHSGSFSSLSQLRYKSSGSVSPKHPRHVDVVEALFSFHRYRVGARFSPTTPFNEDVADRNLRAQATSKPSPKNRYSQLMSAIYQEDVADRNIAKSRSKYGAYGPGQPAEWVKGRRNSRSNSMRRRRRGSSLGSSDASAGWCRTSHDSSHPYDDSPSRLSPDAQMTLRPLASAPDLYSPSISEFPMPPSSPPITSQQRQLKTSRLSPEETDSRANGKADQKPDAEPNQNTDKSEKNGTSQPSSFAAKRRTTRSGSKRNVLDLSINTEIAAARKPAIQIERSTPPTNPLTPRSITPRSIERNASIAEIVNSPLPAPSPSLLTPKRSPGINVEDIMSMFKQASQSTQRIGQESPTIETLQDAIVREINSHDAFRRVPVPDRGPPFTPPASEDSFEDPVLMPPPGPPRIRRDSLDKDKESQFSKLIRKRSLGRKKSKNTSTTEATLKNTEGSSKDSTGTRRRHTYAQPPSAEWLQSVQAGELKAVTSRDTKSRDGAAATDGHNSNAFRSYFGRRKSDPPPLPSLPPARQPATSLSNGDLRQLNPSVDQRPRTTTLDRRQPLSEDPYNYHHYVETTSQPVSAQPEQIRAVDDNNVTYILNATEPLTPLELISAAQQGSKKKNLRGRLEISRPRTAVPFRSSGNKKSVHPIPGRQSSLQNGLI